MLKRRGFSVERSNPTEHLIFPPTMEPEEIASLYEMLRKYSFRLFVRDVIKRSQAFRPEDVARYSTAECVKGYLEMLCAWKIVERLQDGRYRLVREGVSSFGDTLEWFISMVFEWEFDADSMWGVRLGGVCSGGDFDVLAGFEGRLVYVEVKSSPPGNIESEEVDAFVRRVESLRPDLAIFLNDTRLRMADKIVPFFNDYFEGRNVSVQRLKGEIFGIKDRLFITNSSPDIVANIGFCLERYLKSGFWL